MIRELYFILGVTESAPETEIRKAYRRLARKYHPDINPGDQQAGELFKRISEAYEILSNSEKRRFYDQHGYYSEEVLNSEGTRWDLSFRGEGDGESSGFSDLLEGFLKGRLVDERPATSNDVEAQVPLTFEESLHGLTTEVEVLRRRRCRECLGSGVSESGADQRCGECSGTGRRIRTYRHLQFSTACTACRGTGVIRSVCTGCGGAGSIQRIERLRVDVPAGVSSGSRLRFSGKGHTDPKTGERGDLFVVTNVGSHPFFRRAGDNLYCTVPITISEAALGSKVSVPTVDGGATLRIPPGVQSGRMLRLRGKGAPSLRAEGVRGDLYIEVQVVVPRVVDERSREILRELARLHPEDPRKELLSHAL